MFFGPYGGTTHMCFRESRGSPVWYQGCVGGFSGSLPSQSCCSTPAASDNFFKSFPKGFLNCLCQSRLHMKPTSVPWGLISFLLFFFFSANLCKLKYLEYKKLAWPFLILTFELKKRRFCEWYQNSTFACYANPYMQSVFLLKHRFICRDNQKPASSSNKGCFLCLPPWFLGFSAKGHPL